MGQCFRVSSKTELHRSTLSRQPVSTPSTGGDARGISKRRIAVSCCSTLPDSDSAALRTSMARRLL
jgi:hypothetical protein